MKNSSINILIVSMILFALMAIMLSVFLEEAHDDFKETVTVNDAGVTEETLNVRGLSLVPGQEQDYEIGLRCKASGKYFISFEFVEKVDGGMKEFVYLTINSGDTSVYSGELAALIDTDVYIGFDGYLDADDPLTIQITYSMPIDIGNEARNTFADFDIHLKIKKS